MLMFKQLLWLWMAFLLVPSPSAADGEAEEGMSIICPGQYFACTWEEAYWGDARVYWEMLFPENPPFTYACIYLGSFDQEFGFYLDGDELHWAQSAGFQSIQMLSQKPVVDLQTMDVFRGVQLLVHLWAPAGGTLLDGWDWLVKINPGFLLGKGEEMRYVFRSEDGVGMMAAFVESVVNPFVYSRWYVRRGRRALSPALAESLRQTWDQAVTGRTCFMRVYRGLLQGTDGNYCYFRGASGPVGEDLCCTSGKMKASMMDLAHGLIDIMMMDDLNPEAERWLMEQCSMVRRNALELGDALPPMASDEWAQGFADRFFDNLEKKQAAANKKKELIEQGLVVPKEEKKDTEELAQQEEKKDERKEAVERARYAKGHRERFFHPLEKNPLWNDLFPKGSEGKAGALWFGEKGLTGFYLDGTMMARASSLNLNPAQMYCNWFFEGTPERRLVPYEGEPLWEDGAGLGWDYSPRVKRAWMDMGKGLSRLVIRVLNHAASGEIAAGKAEGDSDPDSLGMVIIRGTDGKTRILTPQEEGFETMEKLLECAYSACQNESVTDSAGYIMKYYDMLQGKEPPAEGYPCKECFGINGSRFNW